MALAFITLARRAESLWVRTGNAPGQRMPMHPVASRWGALLHWEKAFAIDLGADMAQAVTCGNCGQPVDVPEDATPDAVLRCPSCGQAVLVDTSSSAAHTVSELLAQAEGGCLVSSDVVAPDPMATQWDATPVLVAGSGAEHQSAQAEQTLGESEEQPAGSSGSAISGACDDAVPAAEAAVLAAPPAEVLSGESEAVALQATGVLSEAQTEPAVPAWAAEAVSMAVGDANVESPAPCAGLAGGGQTLEVAEPASPDPSASPLSDASAPPAAEEASIGVETTGEALTDSSSDSGRGTDGASLAHALADLWQEAGVAPPLEAPRGSPAASPPGQGPGLDLHPLAGSAETAALRGYAVTPPRAAGTFAARAQAQEKVSPRKLVRAVGMLVSGLLAIGLTYGVFRLLGWGTRPTRPRPAASQKAVQKAEVVQPQGPRPGKDEFVPDWKGLKPLDKR